MNEMERLINKIQEKRMDMEWKINETHIIDINTTKNEFSKKMEYNIISIITKLHFEAFVTFVNYP